MTESNLSEKITDAFNNLIKKTKVLEKVENIKYYIGSFVLITSIIGITNITIHFFGLNDNKKLIDNISSISENMNTNHSNYVRLLEKKITDLENRLKLSLEIQQICLNKILYSQIETEKNFSKSFENHQFSVNKIIDLLNEVKDENIILEKEIEVILSNEKLDLFEEKCNEEKPDLVDEKCSEEKHDEDNELLNECYDYMPLNNFKKTTGLNWLFK